MRPIAIIGFGGHAKVVSSALVSLGRTIVAYTCLEPNVQENRFTQVPLYTDEELLQKFSSGQIEVVLGLGSIKPNLANSLIRKVANTYLDKGFTISGFVHPYTWVSKESVIDRTAQIHAGAIVQPGANIGPFSIINTKASIDHDCNVGEACHIAPGATLSGDVYVGHGCHLGTGCTVIQGVRIGNGVMVAAGAVVTKNVPDGCWVKGVPARPFTPT